MSLPDSRATTSDRTTDAWLLVLGMHRSGTSALTGALGAMGFKTPRPGDRRGFSPESNAEHWESLSLSIYNDSLLTQLGGTWEAPPELPEGWEGDVSFSELGPPLPVLKAAFPEPGPRVWKDPRLCIVLPLWRSVLPGPLAAVLIWRSPLAVARSLQERDGLLLADGIALWERYNRVALENLVGLNTFVCNYEEVSRDPVLAMDTLADWLSTLPELSDGAHGWQRAQSTNEIPIHPAREEEGAIDILLPEQRALARTLSSLEGGHRPLQISLPLSESDWTTALLTARNTSRTHQLQIEVEKTQRALDSLRESMSWRITKPLRSVASALGSNRSDLPRH